MSEKSNVLIFLVFLIVQEFTFSEWVELPQFSNGAKVYRIPFTKHETGQKLYLDNRDGPKIYEYGNATSMDENFRRRLKQHYGVVKTTESSISVNFQSSEVFTTMENVAFTDDSETVSTVNSPNNERRSTTENINSSSDDEIASTENPLNNQHYSTMKNLNLSNDDEIVITENSENEEDHSDDAIVESAEEEIVNVPTINLHDKISVNEDEESPETNQSENGPLKPEVDEKNTNNKLNFLAYVPMELFKKVHDILRSQSTTTEGKIDFLKRFKKTLLAEIGEEMDLDDFRPERRLVPVFNPARQKRESRGDDHGWDDHEKGVGFPSLEGALMAISFLTFAVYLVQLVMMLFPNLGVRGVSTILFNRNRRSVDEFTEDTARILDYLDKYAKNQILQ